MQAKAFEYLNRQNLLKHNMKFILEGEEEIGSGSLTPFIEEHKELLKCDVILVSDTGIIAPDVPSITTGLRGLAYWQIEVTGPNRDLHSGSFGGAVANPINVLCKLIADVTGSDGKIRIPGFYDDVAETSAEERKLVASIPFDEEEYKKSIGVKALFGEEGYSTIERTGYRLHSTYAAFGAATQVTAPRPSSHPRPTQSCRHVSYPTRTTRKSAGWSQTISTALRPPRSA